MPEQNRSAARQEWRAEIVRTMNATQRGTGQFRDLEAFVFCREELVQLPGAVAEHDPGGVSTCGCEVYHIRS